MSGTRGAAVTAETVSAGTPQAGAAAGAARTGCREASGSAVGEAWGGGGPGGGSLAGGQGCVGVTGGQAPAGPACPSSDQTFAVCGQLGLPWDIHPKCPLSHVPDLGPSTCWF